MKNLLMIWKTTSFQHVKNKILLTLNSWFFYFANPDKNPFDFKNIELIRIFQIFCFCFIQNYIITNLIIEKLRNIESNLRYLDKKLELRKKLEKKIQKIPKNVRKFFWNLLIVWWHLRKYRLYNLWGFKEKTGFGFPLPTFLIRYVYITKLSTSFTNRCFKFLKRKFWILPGLTFVNYLAEQHYFIYSQMVQKLIFYKKIWILKRIYDFYK